MLSNAIQNFMHLIVLTSISIYTAKPVPNVWEINPTCIF